VWILRVRKKPAASLGAGSIFLITDCIYMGQFLPSGLDR
jgi:hypothetical protein